MAGSNRSGGKVSFWALGGGFGGDAGGRGVGVVEGVEGLVEVALLGCDCLGHAYSVDYCTAQQCLLCTYYLLPKVL